MKKGSHHKPESIEKNRMAHMGVPCPEKAKQINRERWTNNNPAKDATIRAATSTRMKKFNPMHNSASRDQMAATKAGRPLPAHHREKIKTATKEALSDPAIRKKMSESHKGVERPQWVRDRISEGKKGQPKSEEHKKKLSESMKNSKSAKVFSGDNNPSKRPDVRQKISTSLKGKPKSREHRNAISAARTGRTMSPEHRAIISAANKGRKLTPEHRAKISAARKAMGPRNEETKEKLRNISHKTRRFRSEQIEGKKNPMFNLKDPEKFRENVILGINDIWYGGVKYPEDKRKIYCEKWTSNLRERIRACWGYKSALSGKTIDDNGGRALDCHHVYFQKRACCHWDEDIRGYYAIIDGKKFHIKGDPNKFVPLTANEHSAMKFDKIKWIKFFEDLIEDRGGKCYFTKEEMLDFLSQQ